MIEITGNRLVSGEFKDEGLFALITQGGRAVTEATDLVGQRNSGLLRPSLAPTYRLSVGMCMSGCAPTGALTSYLSMVRWTDFSIIFEY